MTWIKIRNRYLANDPVVGATVLIDPPPTNGAGAAAATGTTGRWGTVNINTAGLSNGQHVLRVTPANTTTDPVGPATANAAVPPDRIFRSIDINITVLQGNINNVAVSADQQDYGSAMLGNANTGRVVIDLQPIWMRSPNNGSRSNAAVDTIIIHHTGSQTTSSALNTFLAGNTSAHYVIDHGGRIIKMVRDVQRAHHAGRAHWRGNTNINSRSIGIEIVHRAQDGDYPDAQYTALILLLWRIRVTYPMIPTRNIIGHSDVGTYNNGSLGRKSGDPGSRFNWQRIEAVNYGMALSAAANVPANIYGGYFVTDPTGVFQPNDSDAQNTYGGSVQTGVTGNPITEVQQNLAAIGYASGTANGIYGTHTMRAVQLFQEHFFAGGRGGQPSGNVDLATAIMIKRALAGNP